MSRRFTLQINVTSDTLVGIHTAVANIMRDISEGHISGTGDDGRDCSRSDWKLTDASEKTDGDPFGCLSIDDLNRLLSMVLRDPLSTPENSGDFVRRVANEIARREIIKAFP